jgi:hypothetical protein
VQGKTSVTSGALTIDPGEAEGLWCNPPDRRRVPSMKTTDRAPDVAGGSAIIHEEGVRSAAPSKEIRTGAAVKDIDAAMDCNRIIPRAAMDEPIGGGGADIQAIGRTLMYSFSIPLTGPVYGCPVAGKG